MNRIRWLAKMSSCAVLVINQASDIIDKKRSSLGRSIIPAMGPSWDLNVDENIELTKKGEIREMVTINSPKCETGDKAKFRI
jgi:hypothetical protein